MALNERARAGTARSAGECTALAAVGFMGCVVSKIAVPGEGDRWLVPTMGLIALSSVLLLSFRIGRQIRNGQETPKP